MASIYDTKEYKDSVKRKVAYEWWIEHTDQENDDIEDCYQIDFSEWVKQDLIEVEGCEPVLVLKRYAGSDADGVDDIGHAYIVDGELEAEFCTCHKVPKRYIDQYQKSFS